MAFFKKNKEENFLRLIYCHYVFDDQKEEFEYLIKNLLEIGEFVDTDTCIEMLKGNQEIDKKYFHISFDDGFKNIYTNAFPILKKYNIPAIFFVPSSLVEATYEETSHYCLDTTCYSGIIEMVTWNDLKEMQKSNIEIGSHTKTHARFSEISKSSKMLTDEIAGSKKELEDKLGVECKYISWPYGEIKDADQVSLEMTKEAGYKACFGAYRGKIIPGTTDMFSIPRHHFEVQWPLSHTLFFAKGGNE